MPYKKNHVNCNTTPVYTCLSLQVYMPTVCMCAHARYLSHVYYTHNTQVGML